ncbi:hypothetical protein OAG71_02505 [bacterium]|nr:hypothetical protein [bacterium]
MKFRLGTIFLVVAIVSLLIVYIPPFLDWLNNPPSVTLESVVREFNESQDTPSSLKSITESEVVAAINSDLPKLIEAERVKQVLRRIATKRRAPLSTKIDYVPVPQNDLSTEDHVAVNLSFQVHTKNRDCAIEIRSVPSTK